MDDINRQDALRVHDRSRRVSEATDEATIKAGEVAIRTVMLINGGAAISVLAFIGALVRQDGGLTIKQIAGVSNSLLWFGGGVAAAAWALALSYFTNSCCVRAELSKIFTFEHPYIKDGENTRWWLHWGFAFHVGAIVWGVLSLLAFIVGMIGVRNAIMRIAG